MVMSGISMGISKIVKKISIWTVQKAHRLILSEEHSRRSVLHFTSLQKVSSHVFL